MSENNEPVETPVEEQPTPPAETPNPEATTPTNDAPAPLLTGVKPEGEGDADKEGDGKAEGEQDKLQEPAIPEKYEFDIPEGMQLDEKLAAEVEPILKELQLTQEQANKLTGVWASYQNQQREAWLGQIKDWQGQVKADADLGGDKLDANLQLANETLNRFGATPEFIQFLSDFGLGSHPEMVRFVVNVGKATAEDRPGTTSGAPAAASMSEGERAYQYAEKPARRNTT